MKKCYEGKTKTVFDLENGYFKLIFKDDMTGTDGQFDPGANTVGLTVDGSGAAGLELSAYFFKMLEEKGYASHFVSADINEQSMIVKPVKPFGKGLEIICRFEARGSFIRRYGDYIQEGAPLKAFVEMTLKDDLRGDPVISQEALEQLGILRVGEYIKLMELTQNISLAIKEELAAKGMELCDIKLEFGRGNSGEILLMDELSGGNMRVFKNGEPVMPLELTDYVLKGL